MPRLSSFVLACFAATTVVAAGCAPSYVSRPPRAADNPPPEWEGHVEPRINLGLGGASFGQRGGVPWHASSIARDRVEGALFYDAVGAYAAYTKGLQSPGDRATRWVQHDLEAGAQWIPIQTSPSYSGYAALTVGLGAAYSWMRSGPVSEYEPLLLLFGSGGHCKVEELSASGSTTVNTCDGGETFRGSAWGFTPSVLGSIGLRSGLFFGLHLGGRYLWVSGTNTPSFVFQHEVLGVLGFRLGE